MKSKMKIYAKIFSLLLLVVLAVCALVINTSAAEVANDDGSEATPYGSFTPTEAETPEAYPMAIFEDKGNGEYEFLKLASQWADAVNTAAAKAKSVIYFRADVTPDNSSVYINDKVTDITVDLNGKKLIKLNEAYVFMAYCKAVKTDVNITLKNGEMVHTCTTAKAWRGFIQYNYHTSHTVQDAFMNFTFDNVKFKDERSGNNDFITSMAEDGKGTAGIKKFYGTLTFNNCEFYVTADASSTKAVFNAAESSRNIGLTFVVNGGKIERNADIIFSKLIALSTYGDAVIFGKGENGYTEFVYPTSVNPTKLTLKDDNGAERVIAKKGETGDKAVYELVPVVYGEGAEVTPYGVINGLTGDKADKTKYPIAVFKQNGNYYTLADVYATWLAALTYARTVDSVVYFRSDVTRPIGEAGVDLDAYSTFVTIDLNEKTLTKADKLIFDIYVDKTTATNINITIKNGTLAQQECDTDWRAFIQYNYGAAHTGTDAIINFTFDNVRIEDNRTSLASNSAFIIAAAGGGSNSSGASRIKGTVTYNNCEIYGQGLILFQSNENQNKIDLTYVINGGKISSTKNLTSSNIFTGNSGKDSVTFCKYNGEYTVIELTNGATIDGSSWNTDSGVQCVFAKVSENDTTSICKLMPKVMANYKIKTSITLYSNFVYNIYVPTANVNGFTVNGKTVEYTTETIDGVEYYVVKVDLPAGETLADIALCVTLNSGNTTVDAKWTLNVYNYTKAVLTGNYDDTTKTLMKDMLVYASAAHTYFENTEAVAAKLAEIKTLLGDYNAALPTGEAKQPADKTYFTDVAVYLGAVPSFRFYLADGYTAADFSFKVGGRATDVKSGEGYVEIVMYAYMMLDDVTFTVKGTDVSGTYNLYSYYEYAKTLNNANLVAVVEGLMKYSVSAKDYRNSVINK